LGWVYCLRFKFKTIAHFPAPLRLGIFLAVLIACWLPVALPIYGLFNAQNPNGVTIATMTLLFGAFLILLNLWTRRVYGQSQVWESYGWRSPSQLLPQFLAGWGLGAALILILVTIKLTFGWTSLQLLPLPLGLSKILLEGLVLGFGVACAEELFFRGWLLNEFERDYSPSLALGLNATVFALLHFIKPLPEILRTFPQFPALVLLGISLVWARRICDRSLGLSIGLHGGLVGTYYWVNVGQWLKNTQTVPTWVTGIDGNPLAGALGLLLLSLLAIAFSWKARLFNPLHRP
jgi:membrane protease YdiL (CAAX protease family)